MPWADGAGGPGPLPRRGPALRAAGRAGRGHLHRRLRPSPGEVAAVLAAARTGRWDRVVAVFQPHRYSRTAALWPDFADAFGGADVVVVTDIYPAGEPPRPGRHRPPDRRRRRATPTPTPTSATLPDPRRRGRRAGADPATRRSVPHPRRRRSHHLARALPRTSGPPGSDAGRTRRRVTAARRAAGAGDAAVAAAVRTASRAAGAAW